MATPSRTVNIPRNYEMVAWQWMRYSGILIMPLVGIHVLIKDVLVGVHEIDIVYVQRVWENIGWRIFDLVFLTLVLSHGMNGLRQVLMDFIHGETGRRVTTWILLIVWLAVLIWGALAIINGVRLV
ncbi:MAG TPA: hypothetical protein G4O04_03585 [Anaerolineae bacterium]|nr:hypothetical protein [Anaerolineae bacterium]HID85600.1 hypothetical protein [Anaerolineales bacterium]HIQ09126.1 hypothetical protein [Anaerolineaceae bacterium]